MDIVKKNWLSIVCGVIALIAVAAIPTYVSSQQAKVQKQLSDRKATFDSFDALRKKPRHLPIVSPDPNAVAPDLPQFPGPKVIEAGVEAMKKVQQQSSDLKKLAVEWNTHELLVRGSLPNPANPYEFQQQYSKQFQTNGPIVQALDSVTPPTEEEIAAEKDRREKQFTDDAPKDRSTGKIYDQSSLDQRIAQMRATLADQMRLDASTNHKLYMALSALSEHPDLNPSSGVTKAPDSDTIWYAQMSLWVQQDIVAAIKALNANSHKVDESPVKQIVSISVPTGPEMYALPGAPNAAAGAAPSPTGAAASPIPANSDTDPLPKDYSVSPTGRTCNGVFDVVHFTVTLTVQAADINKVIQALEKGRLITVYASDLHAINSAQVERDGYFFGPHPVASITLQCEELFMRDWTKQYMPPSVKQFLNVADQPQQPTASAQ